MLLLKITIPIASFKESHAREMRDTYPIAPPATVYGMLLSCIGEWNRHAYKKTQLALGLIETNPKSSCIRTFRRFKNNNINHDSNACPDHQKFLTQITLAVGVQGALAKDIERAIREPQSVNRSGGISLGESRDLINDISQCTSLDANWLVRSHLGSLILPYWVDHVGSKHTQYLKYNWEYKNSLLLEKNNWTEIKSSKSV